MKKLYLFLLLVFLTLSKILVAQNIDLMWAKQSGGTNDESGFSITTDTYGNVYTTGEFQGTVDFDPGPGTYNLTSFGGTDVFISKLDPTGNFLWAKQLGGANDDLGHSIAIDIAGNVYTTGQFQGTVDFNPGTGTYNLTSFGNNDIFISKLDASGNFVWAKQLGGIQNDYVYSIAIDINSNVYTTGDIFGTADFDPGTGTYYLTPNVVGSFISKLNASGNFVWAKQITGTNDIMSRSIALDATGNVHITGEFQGTVDFDSGTGTYNLTSYGDRDVFICKLNTSGNFVWAKQLGGTNDDEGNSLAIDANGNVYSTGVFTGTADFDPGTGTYNMTSIGYSDTYVSKLTSSGNFIWAKQFGGSNGGTGVDGLSIALDINSNVYTTGYFQGTIDFDPGTGTYYVTHFGNYDVFISKLDVSGNFLLAIHLGGVDDDMGNSIDVDATGYIYTTGFFNSIADFDPSCGTYNLNSNGSADIFIAKYSQTVVNPSNISLTTFIPNNPYITSYFPNPQTLWSGNTSQTPPIIKICADASTATHISFINNSGINSNNIRFWIASDPYGNNSDLSGYFINYQVTGNTITAEFAHPKYLPSSAGLFGTDNIQIVDYTNPGCQIFTIPIQIYRAPVLFVHGFDGSGSTFASMATILKNNNIYTSSLEKVINYHNTSKEAFASNVDEIPKGINDLFFQTRTGHFSTGKVDIVAHSMGGILSRLYLQNNYGYIYREDVNKLITINTPHSGSHFANWALLNPIITLGCGGSLLFYQNSIFCNGAGTDLRTYSYAIDNVLNTQVSLNRGHVPSHTLSTYIDDWDIGDCLNPILLGFLAVNGFTVPLIFGYNQQMDGFVRVDSQKGGLSGLQTSATIEQCHGGSPDNPTITNDVKQLLCSSPNDGQFSLTGFNPINMKSSLSAKPYLFDKPSISRSYSITSLINITAPISGSSFNPNQTISITATSDTSVKRLVFIIGNTSVGISCIDTTILSNTTTINYTIPSYAIGQIEIDLIGFDPVNILGFDLVTFNVNSNATLDSIGLIPNRIIVPVRDMNHFQVIGYFSDGTTRDITFLSGVQYTMADNSIANIISPGIIKGLLQDSTFLSVSLQTISTTINVYVFQDSTLTLPLFSSNTDVICGNNGAVTFYNLSSGSPQSIQWLFPGGNPTTSSDSIPVINYSSPGIYNVSLIATYPNKIDTLSLPGYITVSVLPASTLFFINDTIFCSYLSGTTYQWFHNNNPVYDNNQSFIHPDSTGEYYVDVTNEMGCIARSDSLYYLMSFINYFSINSKISFYPNPTSGIFDLEFGEKENGEIIVLNNLGETIYRSSILNPKSIINLGNSPAGVYFVRVRTSSNIYSGKIILAK